MPRGGGEGGGRHFLILTPIKFLSATGTVGAKLAQNLNSFLRKEVVRRSVSEETVRYKKFLFVIVTKFGISFSILMTKSQLFYFIQNCIFKFLQCRVQEQQQRFLNVCRQITIDFIVSVREHLHLF
jgi:hypothetical protein